MSHLKERSEKKCLNCNAIIHGRYCHVCGQENLHPEESVSHLATHFFNDITHFDGKFFSTLKYILFKPGFLSSEYKAGRRADYLNPVRLYLFTSALFFLFFFSVTGSETVINTSFNGKTLAQVEKMDSLTYKEYALDYAKEENILKPMTKEEFRNYADSIQNRGGLHFSTHQYKTRAEYDSVLKTGTLKESWLDRQMTYREIEMNQKYNNNQKLISRAFSNYLMHSFPKILFISLPFFALILRILYYRRKHFYYVSHFMFSIHLYVFAFIMMFIILLLRQGYLYFEWKLFIYLLLLVLGLVFFYLYKAMRNFYKQRRAKTIFKFILLNLSMAFVIGILFLIFIFFSLMEI